MNEDQKIKNIKKLFAPSREAFERGKKLFLIEYDMKHPSIRPASSMAFRYFFRGAVTGVAVMLLIGGTASYAHEENVGPTNTLYPLKRAYERVILSVAPIALKERLHSEFAERRFEEIKIIEDQSFNTYSASSKKIDALVSDLKKEVVNSLEKLPPVLSVPEFDARNMKSVGTDKIAPALKEVISPLMGRVEHKDAIKELPQPCILTKKVFERPYTQREFSKDLNLIKIFKEKCGE